MKPGSSTPRRWRTSRPRSSRTAAAVPHRISFRSARPCWISPSSVSRVGDDLERRAVLDVVDDLLVPVQREVFHRSVPRRWRVPPADSPASIDTLVPAACQPAVRTPARYVGFSSIALHAPGRLVATLVAVVGHTSHGAAAGGAGRARMVTIRMWTLNTNTQPGNRSSSQGTTPTVRSSAAAVR